MFEVAMTGCIHQLFSFDWIKRCTGHIWIVLWVHWANVAVISRDTQACVAQFVDDIVVNGHS